MRRTFLFILVSYWLYSCGSGTDRTSSSTDSLAAVDESEVIPYAICVWDKASLKESAEEKGKWLASLTLGEKVTSLDESQTDENATKKREYLKIRLADGKEGWIQKELVVPHAKAGVLVADADIYSRPDLLTKTNKTFKRMDVVAVSEQQGDWIRITGKRKDGSWIDSGFIKPGNISYNEQDIALAVYCKKIFDIADTIKRKAELAKLVDNTDLSGSQFIADLQSMLQTTDPTEMEVESEPDTTGN